jgi:cell division ATPase FtsA
MFKTANEFSMYIENIACSKNITHVEAVLEFCAEHMIDPTDIASSINKSLKAKLEQDFRELNYLPKVAQLDM